MTPENDLILSKLSVRIVNSSTLNVIGSGLIYINPVLKDKVYILTAAHNLYSDADSFLEPINQINIDILNSTTNSYQSIIHTINYDLVLPDTDRDVAVLIINKSEIESITGTIPEVWAIRERMASDTFILKGFPNATKGEELVCINPIWIHKMTVVNKFQLQLNEDYKSWAIDGFSGSGVFLNDNDHLYLFGLFTRYRAEEKGKVIYCQYIETLNELLEKSYLPLIPFTFFGEHGLTEKFFIDQVETAIINLGPRFNEELNLRMPIARLFNDLAKDNLFKHRLLKAIDKWLSAKSYNINSGNHNIIADIESDITSIKKNIFDWLPLIGWSANQKIEILECVSQVDHLDQKIDKKRSELYKLQSEEIKKNQDIKRDYKYNPPYERELNRLREVNQNNYNFLKNLDSINIPLSNYACLIIQGEAGCGKSHLLGDIANERIKKNQPTLLLLGQLFRNGQNVWQNILNQLNLICTKDEFLNSLNNIGQQINSRVIVLIDALNEGAGKDLWPYELAGVVNEFSKYPFIGLAITVRSTYYDMVVPVTVRENNEISHISHEGFKGNEYEALRLFCIHYGIEQPNFPILAPEFTNPLFLLLICEGVKNSGQNKFPQGFQGISILYSYYLKSICNKLINKRGEYRRREHIIQNAIYEMAKACYSQEFTRALPIQKAIELFDIKFTNYKHLLDDLIFENVFIQSNVYDHATKSDIEVYYFAYERIGDFYMANELLQFKSAEDAKEAFHEANELGKLIKDGYWRNNGILEAMAVILPEKFNLEIIEVFDWTFEGNHESQLSNIDDWLNHFLMDSLKWRTVQSIDDKKLSIWIKSNKFNVDKHYYLNVLLELTTQLDHPFNGDRFFRILKTYAMPVRDSFLQMFFRYYSSSDDNGNAFPIRRLIDWAWQANISEIIEPEIARLTGQTLSWILSSTDIKLRDQVTKAMVNLLQEQPAALISILRAFEDIDDLYILERLYGVAYGCALRTSNDESLLKIAQHVFDRIFTNGNPPKHILLRDYAINTVEYAIYKGLAIIGNTAIINPPYISKMPDHFPSDRQMKAYEKDYTDSNFKKNYGSSFNQIHHSVMSWDFGRYVVESALHNFLPYSFTQERAYKDFLKRLQQKHRIAIKQFETIKEILVKYEEAPGRFIDSIGQETYKSVLTSLKKDLVGIPKTLKRELNKDEFNYFTQNIIPHIESKQRTKNWHYNFFDADPIKRWIVQRVFELGYKSEMHGPFDSSIESYNDRSENKIERIGKKYQWIAFYEVMSMITDNYKYEAGSRSSRSKYSYFKGAWQGFFRDVDPVFITRKKIKDGYLDDDIESSIAFSKWWIDIQYNYWNLSGYEWVSKTQDLPDPKHIILSKDESGQEWLYLSASMRWEEPKPIGVDKYETGRKEIWYKIQGYLVHKKDKTKIINWLQNKNFWGRWLPETQRANTGLFSRENYWSQASQENGKEKWENIRDTSYKVRVTTTEAIGETSRDKSGAHFNYEMPCQLIFDGMKLQYANQDGEFKNNNGEIVVINPDQTGVLIRKEHFLQFMDENNLELIWTILGTKTAVTEGSFSRGESFLKVINGVYFIDNNSVSGNLSLSDRE